MMLGPVLKFYGSAFATSNIDFGIGYVLFYISLIVWEALTGF